MHAKELDSASLSLFESLKTLPKKTSMILDTLHQPDD